MTDKATTYNKSSLLFGFLWYMVLWNVRVNKMSKQNKDRRCKNIEFFCKARFYLSEDKVERDYIQHFLCNNK